MREIILENRLVCYSKFSSIKEAKRAKNGSTIEVDITCGKKAGEFWVTPVWARDLLKRAGHKQCSVDGNLIQQSFVKREA